MRTSSACCIDHTLGLSACLCFNLNPSHFGAECLLIPNQSLCSCYAASVHMNKNLSKKQYVQAVAGHIESKALTSYEQTALSEGCCGGVHAAHCNICGSLSCYRRERLAKQHLICFMLQRVCILKRLHAVQCKCGNLSA